MDLPQVLRMAPCLLFLYGGIFLYEDNVPIDKSLKMYNCPQSYTKICLLDAARVLVIYQAKDSRTGV